MAGVLFTVQPLMLVIFDVIFSFTGISFPLPFQRVMMLKKACTKLVWFSNQFLLHENVEGTSSAVKQLRNKNFLVDLNFCVKIF